MPISGRTMSRSVISKTSSCVMPSVIAVQTYGQTCGIASNDFSGMAILKSAVSAETPSDRGAQIVVLGTMCNLYSITTNQAAIAALFRVVVLTEGRSGHA
jgi:hypothetical protein